MNRERWERVNKLFHQVRSANSVRRKALLSEADASDREEVETLLAADRKAGHFLKSSAMKMTAREMAEGKTSALRGRKIRGYTILSLLGAGGMGEVYQARDTRLQRLVAIKLLPREFTADEDLVRRFHQEDRPFPL